MQACNKCRWGHAPILRAEIRGISSSRGNRLDRVHHRILTNSATKTWLAERGCDEYRDSAQSRKDPSGRNGTTGEFQVKVLQSRFGRARLYKVLIGAIDRSSGDLLPGES